MIVLSVESSSVSAGVCVTDGERLLASDFLNCGLTHSRTLLPMIAHVLESCALSVQELDGFAVAAGPGSFTGIRIGVATIKGLAMATGKPCVAVSTLEAMAWGLQGFKGEICCVMDARAGQVYHAGFRMEDNAPRRQCADCAIRLEELAEKIGQSAQILVGDGANLCYTKLKDTCAGLCLAPPQLLYPTGYGVARAAQAAFAAGDTVSADELIERYLRAPQAERERAEKLAQMQKNQQTVI